MSKYTINELANSKGVSQPVREALLQMEAELNATNRQVEILTDALAESRREVDALVALVRADEREACAKVCDEAFAKAICEQSGPADSLVNILLRHHAVAHQSDADAIRARGNT